MDEKIAHLGFIQGVINRMSNNSFLIKGWTVALAAAMLAISSLASQVIISSLLALILFWSLDAYYLRQEKIFRAMHRAVAQGMLSSENFEMDPRNFRAECSPTIRLMFNRTVWPLYTSILIALLAISLKLGELAAVFSSL